MIKIAWLHENQNFKKFCMKRKRVRHEIENFFTIDNKEFPNFFQQQSVFHDYIKYLIDEKGG